jgi:hypothetical protein
MAGLAVEAKMIRRCPLDQIMAFTRDEAFRWLDAALEERSAQLAYARADSRFDYLRPDPRFQDLLDRMKRAHP